MKSYILLLSFCVGIGQVRAQDKAYIDILDSIKFERFTYYAPSDFGYRRDSEVSRPISFMLMIPKQSINLEYTNVQFGFHYENEELLLIKTRLFGEDSLITSQIELDSVEALDIFQVEFADFYENSLESDPAAVLKDRKHALVVKNGNLIFLLNIKRENFEKFIVSANSFCEF